MRSIKSGSHLYHHQLTLLANQNLFYCLFNWRFRRELRDFIFILLLLRLLISKPTWITILTPILIPLEILWLLSPENSHNWRCVNSIQIKSSLRRTSPIPVCPISLTTTTTATSLRLSLSPPPSHLARRDVTLKTPCKCAFCLWIQSICLLFSQLPYATLVVARDSCVVLLLVCSHCLKKLNPVGLVTSIRVQGHCIWVLCICASSCPRRSLSSLLLGMFVYGMAIERLISSRTIARNFKAFAKVARSIVLFD